ncbi:hypothetical protein LINPERHAP2_LOCUS38604 [Linum perenne]
MFITLPVWPAVIEISSSSFYSSASTAAALTSCSIPFHFPIAVQEVAERSNVVVESKRPHSPADIIAIESLPAFFPALLLRGFTGDEADELRNAFLHSLFGFFGNFGIRWKDLLHYSTHVSNRKKPVLLLNPAAVVKVFASGRYGVVFCHVVVVIFLGVGRKS